MASLQSIWWLQCYKLWWISFDVHFECGRKDSFFSTTDERFTLIFQKWFHSICLGNLIYESELHVWEKKNVKWKVLFAKLKMKKRFFRENNDVILSDYVSCTHVRKIPRFMWFSKNFSFWRFNFLSIGNC